ncbi:MAG: hypothetical protein IT430_07435 [Phycisphaerales bacterium]|nr:hypothetical protein [Phycisphaerales bacterium]
MRCTPLLSYFLLLLVLTVAAPGALAGDDRFDDAVRVMRRATTVRSTGEHVLFLSSLRQLSDPDLQPLFSSLSQVKNSTIQTNAVLGLAELSKTHRIDPWKLSQIKDTRFRAMAIIQARKDDLIGPEELRQILTWDDLTEDLRVYVMMVLVGVDEPVDVEALRKLMQDGKLPGTRAYAALALRHLGHPEETDEPLKGVDALPPQVRDSALREIFGTIEYMKLTGAAPWVREQIKSGQLSPGTEDAALHVLLKLDPKSGAEQWQAHYADAAGAGVKVRLTLMLLDVAGQVDASLFAAAAGDENELLATLGRAGQAIAAQQNDVGVLVDLIGQHHVPSTAWVLNHAGDLPPEQASPIYAAMIADTLEEGASRNDRLELARLASAELIKIDATALRTVLDQALAHQRLVTIESILSGALTGASPEALRLIEDVEQWNSNRAQSLALIIKARYAEALTDEDLAQLSLVFRGGGSVTDAAEVQAAWLYLRRTQQQGQALAAILSDLSDGADH